MTLLKSFFFFITFKEVKSGFKLIKRLEYCFFYHIPLFYRGQDENFVFIEFIFNFLFELRFIFLEPV